MMNDLSTWAAKVRDTVQSVERLSQSLDALLPVPTDGTPEQRLALLNEVWASLAVTHPNYPAIDNRALALVTRLKAEIEASQYSFRRCLLKIHEERIRLISAGVTDDAHRVLRAEDFGGYTLVIGGDPNILYGPIDRLAPDHWARSLCEPDDLFLIDGRRPCLVLGNREQSFWEATSVRRATIAERNVQRRHQQEEREKEEYAERQRKEAMERNPDYRINKLESELAEARRRLSEMESKQAQGNGKSSSKR